MKKIISAAVAAILLLSSFSAYAAVKNGNAALYQEQFEDATYGVYADYLVDFDGDGSDEHMVVVQDYSDKSYNVRVWSGAELLVDTTYYDSTHYEDRYIGGYICRKNDGTDRKYLMLKGSIYQTDDYFIYTVVDGKWTQVESWHTEYARGESFDMFVNGVAMYNDDFYAMVNEYEQLYPINQRGGDIILNTAQVEIGSNLYLSDWAKGEVDAAYAAGIVPEILQNPEYRGIITRQQFAALAAALAEKLTGDSLTAAPGNTFTDCGDTAVLKAYNAGIVNGVSDTEFNPGGVLTREQLATMLWRAILYIQDEIKTTMYEKNGSLSGFSDAGYVSEWAREAVAALNENGIMRGTSETELSPWQLCTVEQSIALAYRAYARFVGAEARAQAEKDINSAYRRADLYNGREATAIMVDWPGQWKDIIGVSDIFENNSNEELLVVPRENNSLVEIYRTDYRMVDGEYKFVKEECLYSERSYDGYALLVRSMQYENIPYTMVVVTSPDGKEAAYSLTYCRRDRYYDFERFSYIGE